MKLVFVLPVGQYRCMDNNVPNKQCPCHEERRR